MGDGFYLRRCNVLRAPFRAGTSAPSMSILMKSTPPSWRASTKSSIATLEHFKEPALASALTALPGPFWAHDISTRDVSHRGCSTISIASCKCGLSARLARRTARFFRDELEAVDPAAHADLMRKVKRRVMRPSDINERQTSMQSCRIA